jgi:hypothetical protein
MRTAFWGGKELILDRHINTLLVKLDWAFLFSFLSRSIHTFPYCLDISFLFVCVD